MLIRELELPLAAVGIPLRLLLFTPPKQSTRD